MEEEIDITPRHRERLLALFGLFLVLAAILFLFFFRVFVTSGPSMEPTYTLLSAAPMTPKWAMLSFWSIMDATF